MDKELLRNDLCFAIREYAEAVANHRAGQQIIDIGHGEKLGEDFMARALREKIKMNARVLGCISAIFREFDS